MAEDTPLVEMRNIYVSFGGVHAVENATISLHPGEVVGLVGGNGAGKSTLMKVLSGAYHQDSGEIFVNGELATINNPRDAKALGIETIYQNLALADNVDAPANVFLGREPMTRWMGLKVIDRRRMREEAARTLDTLDIGLDRLDRPVRALSGGQRQCVAIGRALHWQAKIMIMDEPTAALGVPEQRKVLALIQSLKARGVGIIFISHNLQDIFAASDRIVVLRRGVNAGERATAGANPDEIVRMMVG